MTGREGWRVLAVGGFLLGACHPLTSIPTYWPPTEPEHTPAPVAIAPPELPKPKPRPRVAKAPVKAPVKAPAKAPVKVAAKPKPKLKGPPECMSIYVVSAENKLFAFDPQDNQFNLRGKLSCPGAAGSTPFSMAVSKRGFAHVLFQNGLLFKADVDKAACEATPFKPNQQGFRLFGMGYAPNGNDEALYVADVGFWRRSHGLARIDTNSYKLEPLGAFSENPGFNIELTPTGQGLLHGYFINAYDSGGTLVAIDSDNGDIMGSTRLAVGTQSHSLALSWWGGDFYIFTAIPRGTEVTRYDPETSSTSVVATIEQTIVGAGVSTCAPDRKATQATSAQR